MSMLRAEGLRKSYGSLVAVDGVSFEVGEGEVFGLLGPNGAGKSTTLSMVCGLLTPDSGSVAVCGGAPGSASARRALGVAPQELAVYPALTGRENLVFFGRLYGLKGEALKKRCDELLDFVSLSDRAGDRAGAYSGGMKRRLNLACAMMHDPKVLLLDEPTAGVDPQSRNSLYEAVEVLKGQGRAVLYTTHYMEEAQRLCDRVGIIDRGSMLEAGTVEGLIQTHGGETSVVIERAAGGGAGGDARAGEGDRGGAGGDRGQRRARFGFGCAGGAGVARDGVLEPDGSEASGLIWARCGRLR